MEFIYDRGVYRLCKKIIKSISKLETIQAFKQFIDKKLGVARIMRHRKIMAMLMISIFFTAGCLGALEDEVEIPDIDLPLDWKTIVPRAVSKPDLVEFDDCEELELRLKESIAEDYRIQLLQAVEEQYYYFWDDIMLEGDMMAEADGSATGGSSTPTTTRRVEGTDFSGTNNQEGGVDEADVVKTDGYYIYFLNGKKLEIMGVPEFGELVYQSIGRMY